MARFDGRPGHADQLHLDLWWRGRNVAQDAGTYLYNAAPPWDNPLRQADVHNTVTIAGQDQMQSAGRFLYVRRAQAKLVSYRPPTPEQGAALTASHTGYARLGLAHTRTVEVTPANRWHIEDTVAPIRPGRASPAAALATLHWLLPDWPWQVLPATAGRPYTVLLASPDGEVRLELGLTLARSPLQGEGSSTQQSLPALSDDEPGQEGTGHSRLQLARAGQLVYGAGEVKPTWGWSSPTYGDKIPALSIRLTVSGPLPIHLITRWIFPETE